MTIDEENNAQGTFYLGVSCQLCWLLDVQHKIVVQGKHVAVLDSNLVIIMMVPAEKETL